MLHLSLVSCTHIHKKVSGGMVMQRLDHTYFPVRESLSLLWGRKTTSMTKTHVHTHKTGEGPGLRAALEPGSGSQQEDLESDRRSLLVTPLLTTVQMNHSLCGKVAHMSSVFQDIMCPNGNTEQPNRNEIMEQTWSDDPAKPEQLTLNPPQECSLICSICNESFTHIVNECCQPEV